MAAVVATEIPIAAGTGNLGKWHLCETDGLRNGKGPSTDREIPPDSPGIPLS